VISRTTIALTSKIDLSDHGKALRRALFCRLAKAGAEAVATGWSAIGSDVMSVSMADGGAS